MLFLLFYFNLLFQICSLQYGIVCCLCLFFNFLHFICLFNIGCFTSFHFFLFKITIFRIDLCDLLIGYIQNLQPKTASVSQEEKKQELSQDVQEDWKKQKFTVIQSRKETDNDFFSSKNKKKTVKKEKKEEPVNEKQPLHHQFEVLGYFEKLKVPPPLFVNKLEETAKLLKEKRDYYAGLPLEEPKKEEPRSEEKAEEKKHEPKKHEVINNYLSKI